MLSIFYYRVRNIDSCGMTFYRDTERDSHENKPIRTLSHESRQLRAAHGLRTKTTVVQQQNSSSRDKSVARQKFLDTSPVKRDANPVLAERRRSVLSVAAVAARRQRTLKTVVPKMATCERRCPRGVQASEKVCERGVPCCRRCSVRSVSVIRVKFGAKCRNVRGETGTSADPGVPGVPGPRYEGEKGEYGQAARSLLPLHAHPAGVEREDMP